jgi:hypothetical protein
MTSDSSRCFSRQAQDEPFQGLLITHFYHAHALALMSRAEWALKKGAWVIPGALVPGGESSETLFDQCVDRRMGNFRRATADAQFGLMTSQGSVLGGGHEYCDGCRSPGTQRHDGGSY